ncbi:MAG: hypothetical protein HRT45_00785 [Bdellovibrionales bacterium]|nr:hypothetical protein [Bdellovibrionales bacterium]
MVTHIPMIRILLFYFIIGLPIQVFSNEDIHVQQMSIQQELSAQNLGYEIIQTTRMNLDEYLVEEESVELASNQSEELSNEIDEPVQYHFPDTVF